MTPEVIQRFCVLLAKKKCHLLRSMRWQIGCLAHASISVLLPCTEKKKKKKKKKRKRKKKKEKEKNIYRFCNRGNILHKRKENRTNEKKRKRKRKQTKQNKNKKSTEGTKYNLMGNFSSSPKISRKVRIVV